MHIADVMTKPVTTVPRGTTIKQAAEKLKQLDTGFLPISDEREERLVGVTTDRDIVVRCVAEGMDPDATPVETAMTDKVLYCFADDDLESAAMSMAEQQVYRLVVLDDAKSKRLMGIVSMGDIRRQGDGNIASQATDRIVAGARPTP